jgi:hypothetical protein
MTPSEKELIIYMVMLVVMACISLIVRGCL